VTGRPRADERLRRLLAMVPWVAANDGPAVEEVCARFGIDEKQLAADLELLFLCGLYPYTPDMLIEADIAGGRVWIRYAEYFARPLRLTPAEGLALVAAGTALLAVPGTDPEGPLARGLAKLADALGVDPDDAVEVDLGGASHGLLAALQDAASRSRQVEIDYYAYGRDERATRTIDPWAVFSEAGQWYVRGRDHTRDGAERLFRLDRIRAAKVLDATFEPPTTTETSVFNPRPEDPVLTLELEPSASWVAEQYPNEGVEEVGGGRLRVQLRISEQAWLERLLLRLGSEAVVVAGDGADLARDAARRVLRRYSGTTAVTSAAP
jgi:proteasome accessory factor C